MSTPTPVDSSRPQNNLPEKIIFGSSFLGSLGLMSYQGLQLWSTPNESPSRWWIIGILTSTATLSIFGLFRSKQHTSSHDYAQLDTHAPKADDQTDLIELSQEVNKMYISLNLGINPSIQTCDLPREILLKIQQIHTQSNLELQRKEKTLKRTQQDLESTRSENENLKQELLQAQVSMTLFTQQISRLQTLMEEMTNLGPNSPSHSNEIQSILQTLATSSRNTSTNSSVYNSPAKPQQPLSGRQGPARSLFTKDE